MDSSKNGKWINPFKKFSKFRDKFKSSKLWDIYCFEISFLVGLKELMITVEPLKIGIPENQKPLETQQFCQSQISVFLFKWKPL